MEKAQVGAQTASFKGPRLLRTILAASREDATSFHTGSRSLPLNCQTSAVSGHELQEIT